MRLLLLFLLFIGPLSAFAQIYDESCEEAISRANNDFKKGKMQAITYGLVLEADPKFENFYEEYLLEKYGITSINGGCSIMESDECYSDRMNELIKTKYGANIYQKARKEAEALYPNKIKSWDDVEEEENTAQIFINISEPPEFPGGLDSLYRYVEYETNKLQLPKHEDPWRSFVSLLIDTDGKLIEVKIEKGSHPKFDSALVKIMKQLPAWKPGKENGQVVQKRMILAIRHPYP